MNNINVATGTLHSDIMSNQHNVLQQMQKVHIPLNFESAWSRKLEDLRLRLNEPIVPLTNEAILHISTELQPLYKALIMYNLDEFIARNLETALWNDCFKTPLTRYGRTDKNLFNLMIESGVGFYLGLIQDIGVHFDISFITNSPSATKLFCTSPLMNTQFIKPSKSSIYFIIQNCLLHVGDLLRYRGTSYPEAIKMYEKSAAVCPSNGYPYHQMGLTQLLITTTGGEDESWMDGYLSCFYYFARSLSVSNRYLPAFQSIENLVKTKVQVASETKKLSKAQDMLRLFMFSIYENTPAVNLFQMMSHVVQNQQVNASTLVKMIVIALWNNWRNQFVPSSLEIIACIMNSIVHVIHSVIGEAHQHYSYLLPHFKILMEWMSWYQENPTMNFLYSKLNRAALVTVLNQLKTNNQYAQNQPNSWVLEAILPEEKKLIGFIPMDYSICFNAGSTGGAIEPPKGSSLNVNQPRQATMGGHLLSEDKDIALSFNLRIHRIVCVALKLASNKNCFLYDGTKFVDQLSASSSPSNGLPPQPSRRNVALQSIFRTANANNLVDNMTDMSSVRDLVSPSFSVSSANDIANNDANAFVQSLISSTSPSTSTIATTSFTASHDFFRSIWTPDTENSESKWK